MYEEGLTFLVPPRRGKATVHWRPRTERRDGSGGTAGVGWGGPRWRVHCQEPLRWKVRGRWASVEERPWRGARFGRWGPGERAAAEAPPGTRYKEPGPGARFSSKNSGLRGMPETGRMVGGRIGTWEETGGETGAWRYG